MKLNLKLLNLKKRQKKYISFFLDAEPKSKKATKNKSELQKTIIEKLRSRNWEGLKGKIALEITAYSGQQNPPQIEKFVKNIVDIMHKRELLLTKEDESHLPFKDDNYIKYLRAKYVFLDGVPSIHIKIRPFSSFISDIHFVRKELDSSYDGETSTRSNWEDYKELIDGKEVYLRILSNEAYESMIRLKTLDVQKEICDAISITPHIIETLYPNKSTHLKRLGLAEVYRQWAHMLLNVPIRIHLPGIPLKEGDDENYKKKYKAEIKRLMIKYLADHPIFSNLQSPVLITVFYMPPRSRKKNYKDIDNIMFEYIMPAMNEVFRPPISLFNIGMEDGPPYLCADTVFSLPKSLHGSAIGYEIMELPYDFSKKDEGFIIVGFKIETGESSIMAYVDEQIENYMEDNEHVE